MSAQTNPNGAPDPADDARLTAYALGECDEAERLEVEKILASDAAARAAVSEIRAAGAVLSAGLARETGPGLTPEQRAAVLRGGPARERVLARWHEKRLPIGLRVGLSAAAVLVLGIVVVGTVTGKLWSGGGHGNSATSDGSTPATGIDMASKSARGEERPVGASSSVEKREQSLEQISEKIGFRGKGTDVRAREEHVWASPTPAGGGVPLPPSSGSDSKAVPADGAPGMDAPGESKPRGETAASASAKPQGSPASSAPAAGPPAVPPAPSSPPTSPADPMGYMPPTSPSTPAAAPPGVPGAPPGEPGFEGRFGGRSPDSRRDPTSGEAYENWIEQDWTRVAAEPLSTFSLDVDTASYANLRRMLNEGHLPPAGAARIEEMLNYFPYAYAPPKGDDPFLVHLEVAACPWNLEHRLVRIGVKGREVERAARPASNLVFLIDVSGSMNAPNKLPLVKASLRMLVDELTERDHVAIAVYAGASGLVLPPTSCERKAEIQDAIDRLTPGGSTNGAAGIHLAYDVATQAFVAGGTNRVVLCTDGDWNVGVTSHEELVRLIEDKAKSGVFLTVLGFGMGNYKDAMLVKLADKGNGNYGYIDTTREAHKVLVEQASGTLVTIAKDVKVQVEFNPAKVAAYRLIGYEKRKLANQDFNDDTKDAGEIGAGHTVTALYEVTPAGLAVEPPAPPAVDPLKYQPPAMASDAPPAPANASPELLTVKIRYKEPTGTTSKKLEFPVTDGGAKYESASADYKFQAAVAAFGMLLRHSRYMGTSSYDAILELAAEGVGPDVGGYRKEFVELVAKAKQLQR